MKRHKVIKGTFGYKDIPSNSSEDFTHVIFDKEAYEDTLDKKRALENEIKQLEKDYDNKIAVYKKSANDEIAKYKATADEKVKNAQSEMLEQKKIAERYQNLNKNLIRVATERANAKRQLTPKKEHIGYIFLIAEEYNFTFKCGVSGSSRKTTTVQCPCFRFRLQSPYEISFNLEAVTDLIYDDLFKKFGANIGIQRLYANDYFQNWEDEPIQSLWDHGRADTQTSERKHENFVFRTSYKANISKGFWEAEYLSRFAVNIIPEMRGRP